MIVGDVFPPSTMQAEEDVNVEHMFENKVVDLLLSPPSQDAFDHMRLQEMLYKLRHDVALDQIEDVMQILLKCHGELELFLEWKKVRVIL